MVFWTFFPGSLTLTLKIQGLDFEVEIWLWFAPCVLKCTNGILKISELELNLGDLKGLQWLQLYDFIKLMISNGYLTYQRLI